LLVEFNLSELACIRAMASGLGRGWHDLDARLRSIERRLAELTAKWTTDDRLDEKTKLRPL